MYQQYLIKIGNYKIPLEYIAYESYKFKENSQDVDSGRNALGELIRNTLEHKIYKFELNLMGGLNNLEVSNIMNNIRQQFIIPNERRCHVTGYFPEINDYIEQDMYIPDIDYTIQEIGDGVIIYDEIRIAGIGY